ncbi:hypothetical protein CVO74_20240 [Xanthomonas prunicola]|uniref:Uncharacterized protein n=1 Tax=Xanthomonas prunicola TaxID=2053930 RepID=A0A2N3RFU2_9XANT|nr:hypothetical protein XpruCFBP8353_19075 [Xanthomonas prunicola]PKV15561.1 hypothetical protein XpruCFBP8354_19465 [Xanthomonas prunicola]PKV19366.1 hypothetical protein CVO74_20240 [Xanthomonas prunicola]
MDSSLWNLLHDGSIERVDGSVPGDVSLLVSIGYLRNRFPGEGTGFVVLLSGCTHFTFHPYDEPVLSDLAAIAALEPEILSAKAGDPLEICCVMGTLSVRYKSCALSLDNGPPVALSELDAASEAYWREWSERSRAAPNNSFKPKPLRGSA